MIFLKEYTVLSKLNNGGLLHMKIFTPAETKILPVTTDVLTSSNKNDVIEIEEDLEIIQDKLTFPSGMC